MASLPVLIRIRREVLDKIIKYAVNAYPDECCGVLLGRGGLKALVDEEVPLKNVYEGCPGRFWFSDEQWIEALRYAMARGKDYIGLYHSHPDGSVLPSLSDRHRMLTVPSEVWLIVAVSKDEKVEYMAWRIYDEESSVVKLPIEVV